VLDSVVVVVDESKSKRMDATLTHTHARIHACTPQIRAQNLPRFPLDDIIHQLGKRSSVCLWMMGGGGLPFLLIPLPPLRNTQHTHTHTNTQTGGASNVAEITGRKDRVEFDHHGQPFLVRACLSWLVGWLLGWLRGCLLGRFWH
jgi:hypothetical protein